MSSDSWLRNDSSLFQKMHDLIDNCLFGVDFKTENQKGTFSLHFVILFPKRNKRNAVQARERLLDVYDEDAFKLWQR